MLRALPRRCHQRPAARAPPPAPPCTPTRIQNLGGGKALERRRCEDPVLGGAPQLDGCACGGRGGGVDGEGLWSGLQCCCCPNSPSTLPPVYRDPPAPTPSHPPTCGVVVLRVQGAPRQQRVVSHRLLQPAVPLLGAQLLRYIGACDWRGHACLPRAGVRPGLHSGKRPSRQAVPAGQLAGQPAAPAAPAPPPPAPTSSLYSRVCTASSAPAPVKSGLSTSPPLRSTMAGEAVSIQRSSCTGRFRGGRRGVTAAWDAGGALFWSNIQTESQGLGPQHQRLAASSCAGGAPRAPLPAGRPQSRASPPPRGCPAARGRLGAGDGELVRIDTKKE